MDSYRITARAQAQIDRIRERLERKEGVRVAQYVEDAIFDAFEDIVRLPSLGHKRLDFDTRGRLFHNVFQYVIVFRREPRVVILSVVHGARDLPKLLQ